MDPSNPGRASKTPNQSNAITEHACSLLYYQRGIPESSGSESLRCLFSAGSTHMSSIFKSFKIHRCRLMSTPFLVLSEPNPPESRQSNHRASQFSSFLTEEIYESKSKWTPAACTLALRWLHTKTRYMNLSKLALSLSMSALFLCQTPSKPPNLGDAITEQVRSLSYSLKNAYASVSKAFKEGPMTLSQLSKSQISISKTRLPCRMSVFFLPLLSKHKKDQKLLVEYLMCFLYRRSNITLKNPALTVVSPLSRLREGTVKTRSIYWSTKIRYLHTHVCSPWLAWQVSISISKSIQVEQYLPSLSISLQA